MINREEFKNKVAEVTRSIEYPYSQDFVHTHVHTEYSFLDGASKLVKLVEKCKEVNTPLVITDHGNVAGTVRGYLACKEQGVPFIRGMEAYINKASDDGEEEDYEGSYFHLILLPYTQEGFENINLLSSLGYTEGLKFVAKSAKAVIRKEWLEKYGKGIVAMSACMFGEVSTNIWLHYPYLELLEELKPKYSVKLLRVARKVITRKKILTKKSKLTVDDLSDLDVLNIILQKKKMKKIKKILLKMMEQATNEQIIKYAESQEGYLDDVLKIVDYYGSIFDYFYLEIQDHNFFEQRLSAIICKHLIATNDIGTKLVITNDSHYINADDWKVQDVLLCISTRKTLSDRTRFKFDEHELYFKSPEELMQKFSYFTDEEKKEYMHNSTEVAKICLNYKMNLKEIYYPKFDIPEGFNDAAEYLLYLTIEGARDISKVMPESFRYRIFNYIKYEDMRDSVFNNIDFETAMEYVKDDKMQSKIIPLITDSIKESSEEILVKALKENNITPSTLDFEKYLEAINRVIYEFANIVIKEIPDYFLITWQIIKSARDNNILVGPGRGSAAGCAIAYLTGITELDPLDYALYFEREDVALRVV